MAITQTRLKQQTDEEKYSRELGADCRVKRVASTPEPPLHPADERLCNKIDVRRLNAEKRLFFDSQAQVRVKAHLGFSEAGDSVVFSNCSLLLHILSESTGERWPMFYSMCIRRSSLSAEEEESCTLQTIFQMTADPHTLQAGSREGSSLRRICCSIREHQSFAPLPRFLSCCAQFRQSSTANESALSCSKARANNEYGKS